MVMVWSLSVSLTVCFMTSPQFSMVADSMCIPMVNIDRQNVLSYIGGIGVALYILSIALYGHMYLDVKKTNQKTVQLQRENRLARRIGLIVFTNIILFILPLIAIAIVNNFGTNISFTNRYIFWKTFGITCLGINSCLNPILFSFRNEQFRHQFHRQFTCCICKNAIASHC
jgi:nitrate reductase NapE component